MHCMALSSLSDEHATVEFGYMTFNDERVSHAVDLAPGEIYHGVFKRVIGS